MQKSNLTVVIPTANRRLMIKNCLNSVLSQSVLPERIIIVDNGADRCFQNEQVPSIVNIIQTEINIGASKARNIGLRNVESTFVAFLDDDDIWDKDFLKNLLGVIYKEDCEVVVGSLYRRNKNSNDIMLYKQFPAELINQRKVYYSNPGIGGQNFLGKTDFLIRIGGFNENIVGSEDRDIAAKILENFGRIVPVPNAIAILCDHDEPRNRLNKRIRGLRQFIHNHKDFMTKKELLLAYIKALDHFQKIIRRKLF